jgi:hypothetical protein
MTPCFINPTVPNAINEVKAFGISSGRMPIARVRPFKKTANRQYKGEYDI